MDGKGDPLPNGERKRRPNGNDRAVPVEIHRSADFPLSDIKIVLQKWDYHTKYCVGAAKGSRSHGWIGRRHRECQIQIIHSYPLLEAPSGISRQRQKIAAPTPGCPSLRHRICIRFALPLWFCPCAWARWSLFLPFLQGIPVCAEALPVSGSEAPALHTPRFRPRGPGKKAAAQRRPRLESATPSPRFTPPLPGYLLRWRRVPARLPAAPHRLDFPSAHPVAFPAPPAFPV